MVDWLHLNLGSEHSDFVIKAWLETTRDFATVRISALIWLKENTENPEAVYVLKFITRERDLPSDAVEDVIKWCTNFPNDIDTICRIGPVLTRYAYGDLEQSLSEVALLVLEHIKAKSFTDKGVRNASLATIAELAWRASVVDNIEQRLDAIHANFLLNSTIYTAQYVAQTPPFVLNPSLIQHVASMVVRKIVRPHDNMEAFSRFVDWLAAWPSEKKIKYLPALQTLKQHCPIPGRWSRLDGKSH